jgi:hypothetical protein
MHNYIVSPLVGIVIRYLCVLFSKFYSILWDRGRELENGKKEKWERGICAGLVVCWEGVGTWGWVVVV